MKKTAVLFGGKSSEYKVSLQSAAAVMNNLDSQKYELIPIGISETGDWYYYQGNIDAIRNNRWQDNPELIEKITWSLSSANKGFYCLTHEIFIPVDFVFIMLHGLNGEDGSVQGLFQLCGIPYSGCGVLSSALCMDKARAHYCVAEQGIHVPKTVIIKANEADDSERIALEIGFPLFVKPLRAGSSHGISKVQQPEDLKAALEHAWKYDADLILEEAVSGIEIGCSIIGNECLEFGIIDEVHTHSGFYDFNKKYTGSDADIIMPTQLTAAKRAELQELARSVYRLLDCSGYARIDFFLNDSDEFLFNEVNTIPGFTAHSRFPKMMLAAGMTFSDLLDLIITYGEQR